MRVGVIGPVYPDSFAQNIGAGLTGLGLETHHLGPATPRTRYPKLATGLYLLQRHYPAGAIYLQRRLVAKAVELQLDVVISVDANLAPATITELRRARVKTALWYPDHVGNLERAWLALAPYDGLFFKEPVLVERLSRTLELPAHYLPEACNPAWHRVPDDVEDGPCEADGHVVVVGNLYGTKARLLSLLISAGVPIKIYGPPPARPVTDSRVRAAATGVYIARETKARVFRRAVAVLNSMHPAEIDGVNARLFEATACGGTVVTEHRREVPALFRPGAEVLSYSSLDELVGHIKQVRADPEAARAIGDAATRRAHSEHTYPQRLSRLLEVLA